MPDVCRVLCRVLDVGTGDVRADLAVLLLVRR